MNIHTYTHAYLHTCLHTHTYLGLPTYIHTYIHIIHITYTYIHIHTGRPIHLSGGSRIFRGAKGGGGLTIGQHPQPSSDYEEDYVIGVRRPEFRGGGWNPLTPPRIRHCTYRPTRQFIFMYSFFSGIILPFTPFVFLPCSFSQGITQLLYV